MRGKHRSLNNVTSHFRTAPESWHLQRNRWPRCWLGGCRSAVPALHARAVRIVSQWCSLCCPQMALARENTVSIRDSTTSQASARGWGQSINCRLVLGLKWTHLHFWSIQETNPWHHSQGIALPWWFVIEIGLPPALLALMPPVQLWESFFFLKLHSFLVLMTKGGPPQASLLGRALPGACRLLPGPDDNLSQLCFKVTFQPFLLSCGKRETETKTTKVSTRRHFKMFCFASFGLGSLLCNSHHSCPEFPDFRVVSGTWCRLPLFGHNLREPGRAADCKEAPLVGVRNLVCLRIEVTSVWRPQVKRKN